MSVRNHKQHKSASDNSSESGSALVMVLVGMTILGLFATVSLTYSTQTLKVTRHTQDFLTSLAAAQGGVDEYISRLNREDGYWQRNPAAVPPSMNPDCTNIAMQKPMPAGVICG